LVWSRAAASFAAALTQSRPFRPLFALLNFRNSFIGKMAGFGQASLLAERHDLVETGHLPLFATLIV
jgi:hypothetical protein